jgi:hypothetical protein
VTFFGADLCHFAATLQTCFASELRQLIAGGADKPPFESPFQMAFSVPYNRWRSASAYK